MMAMCMTVSSCGDDDDEGGDKPTPVANDVMIEGSWMAVDYRSSNSEAWNEISGSSTWVWSFAKDGTFKSLVNGTVTSLPATYEVDGSTVTITYNDNSHQIVRVYQMDGGHTEADTGFFTSDGTLINFYRLVRCPATAAEAKKMLMAQWKFDAPEGYFDDSDYDIRDYDETYMDFSKEGKEFDFEHIKDNLSSDHDYYNYRGKYICKPQYVYNVEIEPYEKDLTECTVYWTTPSKAAPKSFISAKGTAGSYTISRLCYQSFILDGYRYTRVEKPIEYEVLEWGSVD